MEYHRTRKHEEKGCKKTVLPTEVAVLQPDVAQQAVCDPGQRHDRLHVVGHFYKGQEKGQQIQGIVEPVVSKIPYILPAAQLHGKVRPEIAGPIKFLPEILRKYNVLGEPVGLRSRQIPSAYLHQSEKDRYNCKYQWKQNFPAAFHLLHHWNSLRYRLVCL